MSRSWSTSFTALSSDATSVLKAMALLGVVYVNPAELAAALERSLPETEAAVEALRQGGWVVATPSGPDMLDDRARIWLENGGAGHPTSGEALTLAGRLIKHQTDALDASQHDADAVARWVSEHREGIVAAVRAGTEAGEHGPAATLAMAAWQVADQVADPLWWHDLARHGEDAAIQGRDPAMLIALLRRSAVVFGGAEELGAAEDQWTRALRLADELGDHERSIEVLTAQVELYRKWGRRNSVMDTLLELADEHQAAGNPIGRANALAELGCAMLAAGRASSAETYLARADELLAQTGTAVSAAVHARVVEQWGRVLWRLGQTIRARRCFSRALDMLVGIDDAAAADRVRALLAVPVDAELPPE